jgi:GNAT superfamily N-acetyltransferase
MTGLNVRTATRADIHGLATLRWLHRQELAEAGEPLEERNAFLRRCHLWMTHHISGDWRAWVIDAEGELVGAVWAHLVEKVPNPVPEAESFGYVTNLYVAPPWRGHGRGSLLMQRAMAWLSAHDVDEVVLWPSTASIPLYQRLGFEMTTEVYRSRLR